MIKSIFSASTDEDVLIATFVDEGSTSQLFMRRLFFIMKFMLFMKHFYGRLIKSVFFAFKEDIFVLRIINRRIIKG